MAFAPQVYNGITWDEVDMSIYDKNDGIMPEPPAAPLDGSIFINLAHLKDEKRCADTIARIFSKAKDPKRVFIGLVEHNENTKMMNCLATFCINAGAGNDVKNHPAVCPHYDQIQTLSVFSKGAKGPTVSRALGRKLLGNQEFCMQIDSHSSFIPNWDEVAIQEWASINNEYAVLSNRPADSAEMAEYGPGGSKEKVVNRFCNVELNSARLPMFSAPTQARNLNKPLIMKGWSAAFSFAKCHLEESTPYDFFLPQIFQGEEFPRFARMWTRGYDVYTPTRNIVFHDYTPTNVKWPDSGIQRKWAQERIRTLLQMPTPNFEVTERMYSNLNLYGLGARRSFADFMSFVGYDLKTKVAIPSAPCSNPKWYSYDRSISALQNKYTDVDNEIDPLPIMPLRSKPVLSQPNGSLKTAKPHGIGHPHEIIEHLRVPKTIAEEAQYAQEAFVKVEHQLAESAEGAPTPVKFLVVIWLIGISAWVIIFARRKQGGASGRSRRKMMNGSKNH